MDKFLELLWKSLFIYSHLLSAAWALRFVEFVCSSVRSNWPQVLCQFPGAVTWRHGRNPGHALRWALETSPPS